MTTSKRDNHGLSSYVQLVRGNANFRYLWYGQIVSLLGDWFNLIASASLVASLTNSGLAVGGLFVVRMLAPFLVSPVAGVAADRYNRKHLLILSDLLRALTVLGFLMVRQPEHVWLLYALTIVQLGLSGFFFPTRNAILPDIIDREDLGTANALSSATWSVMLGLGAAMGGLVAGQWGVYPSFIIDGLTFILSAVILARISYDHKSELVGSAASISAATRQYVDGLRYLLNNVDILTIALHKAAGALFISGAFQVAQVAVAENVFVMGEGGGTSLGIMYAVVGIGTGVGPIVARYFTGDRDRPQRIAIALSYGITAVGMVMMAPLSNFGVALIGIFLRGVGLGIGWVFSTQLLLLAVPDKLRGRVFSTEHAMFTLMNAISAAIGGWTLDQTATSLSGVLWWMAALILLPGILWALWIVARPEKQAAT